MFTTNKLTHEHITTISQVLSMFTTNRTTSENNATQSLEQIIFTTNKPTSEHTTTLSHEGLKQTNLLLSNSIKQQNTTALSLE